MAYPLPKKYEAFSPEQKATVDSIRLYEVYHKFRPAMNVCGNCTHAIRAKVVKDPDCRCTKHNVPVHGAYCCEDFALNPNLIMGRSLSEPSLDGNKHGQPESVRDPLLEQSDTEHRQSDIESHHHTPVKLNLQDDAVRQGMLCELRQHKEQKDKLNDDLRRAFQ